MKKVYSIIEHVFEKDFFYTSGPQSTINNIEEAIRLFDEGNPKFTTCFLEDLCEKFPNAKIENWTQFFNNDRCIRFLIEINKELRFIAQVSVFNFFSVYQHSMELVKDKYKYGDLVFIDRDESDLCNLIYDCANGRSENLVWLERDLLNQVIEAFSILVPDEKFCFEITIADALFTSHHI